MYVYVICIYFKLNILMPLMELISTLHISKLFLCKKKDVDHSTKSFWRDLYRKKPKWAIILLKRLAFITFKIIGQHDLWFWNLDPLQNDEFGPRVTELSCCINAGESMEFNFCYKLPSYTVPK